MRLDIIVSNFDIITSLFIILVGLFFVEIIRKKLLIKQSTAFIIYAWHSLFSIAYMFIGFYSRGDSSSYYLRSIDLNFKAKFGVGTDFINYIMKKLSEFFSFSLLEFFLLFGFFGTIGLLFFYSSIKIVIQNKSIYIRRLAPLLIFLPGLNFWSSAIGKDSIAILSIGIFSWWAFVKKTNFAIISSILIMFLIRPHIAGLLIISFFTYLIFVKRSFLRYYGLITLITSTIAGYYIVSYGVNYANLSIDDISLSTIKDFLNYRQTLNQDGALAIDIQNKNILEKIFTYLFYPIFNHGDNFFIFVASIENLIVLLFFILCLTQMNTTIKKYILNHFHTIVYSFLFLYIMSSATANLGIALRQKWMILPLLILLFINLSKDKKNYNKN